MKIGSIVFGPTRKSHNDSSLQQTLYGSTINGDVLARACNCIGPQPGETKCPCALQGEADMGRKMIADGVMINGKRYRLVPDPQ